MSCAIKPRYRDRKGRERETTRWYAEFQDHRGFRQRFRAYKDKAATEELARKLQTLAEKKAAGELPDPLLSRWVLGLESELLERLVRLGIVSPSRVNAGRSVTEHVQEFVQSLRDREKAPRYVDGVAAHLGDACRACAWRSVADVDRSSLERYLADLRTVGRLGEDGKREPPISAKTSNHVLGSVKAFMNWAVERGYAVSNPLARVKGLNAKVDPRWIRRALDTEELCALVQAAQAGPRYRGTSGEVRALVWRLASECGLRVGEIVGLKVQDLELDPARPTLKVRAAISKNGLDAWQPLRPELADDLARYAVQKLPGARLLPLPAYFGRKAALWLRFDLARARVVDEDGKPRAIPYEDASGRVCDVHSLRSSYVSRLMRSGANAKLVQTLARHSTPSMTLGIYARFPDDEARRAVMALEPITGETAALSARATGTDAVSVAESGSAPSGDERRGDSGRHAIRAGGPKKAPACGEVVSAPGIEPGTYWLKASCSTG